MTPDTDQKGWGWERRVRQLTGAAVRWSTVLGPPSASSPSGLQPCAVGHSSWQAAGAA